MNNLSININKCNKCNICNKRLKLTAIPCKCNLLFCDSHKYPELHDCSFNYLGNNQAFLSKNIQTIKSDKIIKL